MLLTEYINNNILNVKNIFMNLYALESFIDLSTHLLMMGKPTKTNLIPMTLRPKYGDHQVQHTAQDT